MTDLIAKAKAAYAAVPEWVRKIARDALEGAIVAAGTLTLVIPRDLPDAQAQAMAAAVVVGSAALAVVRRELLPALLERLRS